MMSALPMFDTHAHLFDAAFEPDREEVIRNAIDSGVGFIVVPATDVTSSGSSVELAETYPQLYAAVGVHPHEAAKALRADLSEIDTLANQGKVVAIGEIGLDYFYDFSPKDVQINLFREQLAIAVHHNLPVIIHTRDSLQDAVRIVEGIALNNPDWGKMAQRAAEMTHLRGVFHCYTGDLPTALRLRELGFLVSYPGIVTFKRSNVAETVRAIGFERFLIETDSPYLAPVPIRGKRNEPRNLKLIVKHLSQMFEVDEDEVISATTSNALRLFNLPPLSDEYGADTV